jgi:arylsulfatase A-like enzyme
MVVHDEQIGEMLDKLDELGIADNTIVMYSTDNGPENDTWPDGANTPFRGQKDTNWEGGWRVPCFIRWPGKIKAGSVLNGIVSHIDMLPTLLAAPAIRRQGAAAHGYKVGDKTYKVHLDGYNMVPYLTGEVKESPRKPSSTSATTATSSRCGLATTSSTWRCSAPTDEQWAEPFVKLRLPHIMNLRRDPFERADFNSNTYWDWMVDHVPQMYLMQDVVAGRSRTSRSSRRGRSRPRSTSTR